MATESKGVAFRGAHVERLIMLKSNWSIGQAREAGRAYVIRQRLGTAPARKSQAVHKYMSASSRMALCAKLERQTG